MAEKDKADLRKAQQRRQDQITKAWQAFAMGPGKLAIQDLFEYVENQREMYRKYAENRAMPSPDRSTETPALVAIDNETIAALLQNSRGMYIVKTYIANRIHSDVAQPIKSK